jgi:hypothetical protein
MWFFGYRLAQTSFYAFIIHHCRQVLNSVEVATLHNKQLQQQLLSNPIAAYNKLLKT